MERAEQFGGILLSNGFKHFSHVSKNPLFALFLPRASLCQRKHLQQFQNINLLVQTLVLPQRPVQK
jgi:hypothetical protein